MCFLVGLPFLALAWCVTWLLKETPLRDTAHITMPVDIAVGVDDYPARRPVPASQA